MADHKAIGLEPMSDSTCQRLSDPYIDIVTYIANTKGVYVRNCEVQ